MTSTRTPVLQQLTEQMEKGVSIKPPNGMHPTRNQAASHPQSCRRAGDAGR